MKWNKSNSLLWYRRCQRRGLYKNKQYKIHSHWRRGRYLFLSSSSQLFENPSLAEIIVRLRTASRHVSDRYLPKSISFQSRLNQRQTLRPEKLFYRTDVTAVVTDVAIVELLAVVAVSVVVLEPDIIVGVDVISVEATEELEVLEFIGVGVVSVIVTVVLELAELLGVVSVVVAVESDVGELFREVVVVNTELAVEVSALVVMLISVAVVVNTEVAVDVSTVLVVIIDVAVGIVAVDVIPVVVDADVAVVESPVTGSSSSSDSIAINHLYSDRSLLTTASLSDRDLIERNWSADRTTCSLCIKVYLQSLFPQPRTSHHHQSSSYFVTCR